MRLPISMYWPPPRSFGITKVDMDRRNTIMIPLTTPGMESFQVILQKVWKGLAPRSLAASISDLSILLKDVWIGMIIKGIKLQTRPTITEKSVYIMVIGEIPSIFRRLFTRPLSERMFIHA